MCSNNDYANHGGIKNMGMKKHNDDDSKRSLILFWSSCKDSQVYEMNTQCAGTNLITKERERKTL